jgi:hypothetical protein
MHKMESWKDKKLERRTVLKKAAIGAASLAALYVAPNLTSVGSKPAYASITGGTTDDCIQESWLTAEDGFPQGWHMSDFWFDHYFEIGFWANPFASMTIQSALSAVHDESLPCDVAALARHAMAALLNAASDQVQYPYTASVVGGLTNDVLSGGSCNQIQELTDFWIATNEQNCFAGAKLP